MRRKQARKKLSKEVEVSVAMNVNRKWLAALI